MAVKREIPIVKCSGGKNGISEPVVRSTFDWVVCSEPLASLRRTREERRYGFSIVTETKQGTCLACVDRKSRNVPLSIGAILTSVARPNNSQFRLIRGSVSRASGLVQTAYSETCRLATRREAQAASFQKTEDFISSPAAFPCALLFLIAFVKRGGPNPQIVAPACAQNAYANPRFSRCRHSKL